MQQLATQELPMTRAVLAAAPYMPAVGVRVSGAGRAGAGGERDGRAGRA